MSFRNGSSTGTVRPVEGRWVFRGLKGLQESVLMECRDAATLLSLIQQYIRTAYNQITATTGIRVRYLILHFTQVSTHSIYAELNEAGNKTEVSLISYRLGVVTMPVVQIMIQLHNYILQEWSAQTMEWTL